MLLASAPTQLVLPWANGDSSKTNPIPVASQIGITPGAASFTDGFPPLCGTPVTSGGIPPAKADMNGGLFQMSAVDVWSCAGGGFKYSSAFSTAIGGYPLGARVLIASGLGYWRSIVDNNTTNPDTGGAGWVREPGSGVHVVAFSATPTFDFSLADILEITLAGNVTGATVSNLYPGQRGIFIIHQNATGGFTFAWPSPFSGWSGNPDPTPSLTSIQKFIVDSASVPHPDGGMSVG